MIHWLIDGMKTIGEWTRLSSFPWLVLVALVRVFSYSFHLTIFMCERSRLSCQMFALHFKTFFKRLPAQSFISSSISLFRSLLTY